MSKVERGNTPKKLPAAERRLLSRVDNILLRDGSAPGGLIPVLQKTQDLFGYLPEPVLARISLRLGLPYSEVAGVVGFYSFFTTVPRGRHVIRVCLGTACYVRGGRQILEALTRELNIGVGETTDDRLFSLQVARCFGACALAPTLSIDAQVYKRVRPIDVPGILAAFRNGASRKKKRPAKR